MILGVFLGVAACEKEVILPGVREDIRESGTTDVNVAERKNESRPIRLPAQSGNADWPQAIGTERFRTPNPALRATPQQVWSVNIGAGNSRRQRIVADPVVAGGRVFTLDASARVSAVSTSGALLWSADLTPERDRSSDATGGGLAVAGGTLYVTLGFGDLVALDAASGAVRWRQRLDAAASGPPTVFDGRIYLAAGDETGWAVRAEDGLVDWQFDTVPSLSNVLGAPAPALTGKFAVFAFGNGDVVAVFRRGGLRRWNAAVTGERPGRALARIGDITGAPVVSGSRLYAANQSGRLVALDIENGDRLWTAREGAVDPVWPAGDSVFAVTDRQQLIRVDIADGQVIWAAELPGYVKDKPRRRGKIYASFGPILAGGRILVASGDGFVRSFAPEDGRMLSMIEVLGGAATAPVVAGNTLYVVSAKGELFAFR